MITLCIHFIPLRSYVQDSTDMSLKAGVSPYKARNRSNIKSNLDNTIQVILLFNDMTLHSFTSVTKNYTYNKISKFHKKT